MERSAAPRPRPTTRGRSSTWSSPTSPSRAAPGPRRGRRPGEPARALLRALGIEPARRGQPRGDARGPDHLAEIRAAVFERRSDALVSFVRPDDGPVRGRDIGRMTHRPNREECGNESSERGQGPREDPGAGLGAPVPRAGVAVRNRLHVPEGARRRTRSSRSCGPTSRCRRRRTTASTAPPTAPSAATCSARCRSAGWSGRSCSCRIIPLPEISAARAMPLLFRTVPNPELHNGQAIQMIDEVRHSTIQQNLKRLYMNNYIDPAGFNSQPAQLPERLLRHDRPAVRRGLHHR